MSYDTTARTTATSAAEGRLKVGVGRASKKSALKAILKKKKKDGAGGPGVNPLVMPNPMPAGPSIASQNMPGAAMMNPGMGASMMTPPQGTTITPNTLTPQQQMQMAMQGAKPAGATQVGLPGGVAPRTPKKANRPHRNTSAKPKSIKGAKKMKIVKAAVSGAKKSSTNAYKPLNLTRRPVF